MNGTVTISDVPVSLLEGEDKSGTSCFALDAEPHLHGLLQSFLEGAESLGVARTLSQAPSQLIIYSPNSRIRECIEFLSALGNEVPFRFCRPLEPLDEI